MPGDIEPHYVGLEERRYNGRIVKVEEKQVKARTGEMTPYLEIFIDVEDTDAQLKFSAPKRIGINRATKDPTTKLAKFVSAIGFNIEKKLKLNDLVGRKLSFVIANEKTETGVFARIVEGTVQRA